MNTFNKKSFFGNAGGFPAILDDIFNTSISDILGGDFTFGHPAVNIIEEDGHYLLEVAAPGLTKEDFEINIEKDHLVVRAEKSSEKSEEEEGKFTRREFNYGSFNRKFYLPENIDRDSIEASYDNGLLAIRLDKKTKAESVSHTIKVK